MELTKENVEKFDVEKFDVKKLDDIEKLDVGQHSGALFCKEFLHDTFEAGIYLLAEIKRLRKEIAELKKQHNIQKWHYTKDGDYPVEDGEYQIIVKYHRGAYVTTVDNWDCDLQVFTESCYPENIIAWAELSLQPEDLMEHV